MADEERYETDARDWLDSVDVPPPRLEVAQIVQIGRSQARRRRLLTAGGTVAALAALAGVPATVPIWPSGEEGWSPSYSGLPPLDCDVTELPLPDELSEPEDGAYPDVSPAAIDPSGRYIVANGPFERHQEPDGSETISDYESNWLVLWDSGEPTAISPLRGGAMAADVNVDGVVVGTGSDAPGSYYAWIYRDGEMSELPIPDGYAGTSGDANAINATGDVVGTVVDEDDQHSVVVWRADDLENPQVLTGPASGGVVAEDITDDSTVIARHYTVDGHQGGGYRWAPEGTGQALPLPSDAIDVTLWAARGNLAAGNVLMTLPSEETEDEGGNELTVIWDLATGTLEVLEHLGTTATVSDIAATGDVLYAEALLLRDGSAYALPDPFEEGVVATPDTDYSPYVSADGISDDGSVIIGTAAIYDTPDFLTHAVHPIMWRC